MKGASDVELSSAGKQYHQKRIAQLTMREEISALVVYIVHAEL